MLFSSWQFIFVFLPIAVAGFFAIPARAQVARKWWLLVVSLAYGMPVVLLETFDPPTAVEVYNRHGVTMAGGSTAFYFAFLNEARSKSGG